MKKVYQTKLHTESQNGNCLAAAMASFFELDLDEVPKFEEMSDSEWFGALNDWIASQGFRRTAYYPEEKLPNGLIFVLGQSPRGIRHIVLYEDGKMVHDPHPSEAGLISFDSFWVLESKKAESNFKDYIKVKYTD